MFTYHVSYRARFKASSNISARFRQVFIPYNIILKRAGEIKAILGLFMDYANSIEAM